MSDTSAPHSVFCEVIVGSAAGLHARPAAMVVQAATKLQAVITIQKDNGPLISARSIMSLLTGGIHQGDRITLHAVGESALDDVKVMAELIAKELDEEAQH
ncbi:MAG: HPr family phosphocarrier protein [Actinobacteria bacterium]|uniref:Unannotated protein n=1 Tax=freshwater metagenome TaxID=449393 RepID=A0A6J7VSK5_9ZZZZ|nr:HPr family phosphocarrier protein [Actinomycetota bacterium]